MDRAPKDECKGLLLGSSSAPRSSDVPGHPCFPFGVLGKVYTTPQGVPDSARLSLLAVLTLWLK